MRCAWVVILAFLVAPPAGTFPVFNPWTPGFRGGFSPGFPQPGFSPRFAGFAGNGFGGSFGAGGGFGGLGGGLQETLFGGLDLQGLNALITSILSPNTGSGGLNGAAAPSVVSARSSAGLVAPPGGDASQEVCVTGAACDACVFQYLAGPRNVVVCCPACRQSAGPPPPNTDPVTGPCFLNCLL